MTEKQGLKKDMRTKKNESGRSMVEMLGVLAIMGLLSIGGVIGYRWAMDMYYASATIKEINQRAVVYSQQMIGGQSELSSKEFNPENATAFGYPLTANVVENQPSFRIELNSVPKGVCQNIVDADWYVPFSVHVNGTPDYGNGIECPIKENKMVFYFHRDLTEEMGESSDSGSGWRPEESWMFICRSNNDCGRLEPVCDTDTGKCGPCTSNNDCSRYANYPVCNTETGACEKCETNADCASVPGKPVCLTTQGRCVECLTNPDCGDNPKGEICNENNYTCRPCEWDSDCEGQPNGEVCDTETGICVECLDNPDCVGNPNGEICMTEFKTCGQCEARSCTDTAQCGPNETCTDGKCVCPNGFWIRNCECVACPEGSTPVQGDDAVECVCDEANGFFWNGTECEHCIQGQKVSQAINNNSFYKCTEVVCNPGYYYRYNECPEQSSDIFTTGKGSCQKIEASEDGETAMSDDALVSKYKALSTRFNGGNPASWVYFAGDPATVTAADIRKKLKELLKGFVIPKNCIHLCWENAKSWCLAQGYKLATADDIGGIWNTEHSVNMRSAIVLLARGSSDGSAKCTWIDGFKRSFGCFNAPYYQPSYNFGASNSWEWGTVCKK